MRTIKSDAMIHTDVVRELRCSAESGETDLDVSGVDVDVEAGTVTLSGTVDSLAKKWYAQEAAHRVEGVRDVANDIEVKIPDDLVRPDTEIAQAVRYVLAAQLSSPHYRVTSTVDHGWVILEGTVRSNVDREDAARMIHDLWGVRGVSNWITVEPSSEGQPAIRAQIARALGQYGEQLARSIQLTMSGDTVVVGGHVHTWPQRLIVLDAVRSSPGVQDIKDRLVVDPHIG